MKNVIESRERLAYRPDIDGLRSVAVIAVVLFHLGFAWVPGGYVGVDVFFVISGFLITGIIVEEVESSGTFDFYRFYLRRLRRLGPALLFTLFFTSLAAAFLFAPHDLQRYGASLFHAVLSLSNVYFWTDAGYFDGGSEINPLLHTWSLSVEEQFYMIWPVALVTLLARSRRRTVIRVLIAAAIVSLLLNLGFDDRVLAYLLPGITNDTLEQASAAMFFLTPFRIFELAIGAALVFLPAARTQQLRGSEFGFLIGCLLIGFAALEFGANTVFPSYNALAPCLGTALIISAGNPRIGGALLRNKVAVWVGLRSYSLYLIHWPIIVFCRYWDLEEFMLGEQLAIALAAVLAAAAMYRFVEQPFRRRRDAGGGKRSSRRFVVVCSISACLLMLVGANEWGNRGWIWRLDARAEAIFEGLGSPDDFHKQYYGGVDCKPVSGCVINRGRNANVYFVGDSHMLQYAAGLAASFPQLQFTHISNRCRFNTLELCYAGRWQESQFVAKKAAALARLRESSDPIVIGQAWYNRQRYYDPRTRTELTFDDDDSYIDFLARHLEDVDRYFGHGRIVVIGEVNRFGRYGDPLTCLGKPWSDDNCTYSPRSFAPEFNRRLGEALSDKGIAFINPTDEMCSAKGCLSVSKGMPVYSDIGHLSVWGSKLIVAQHKAEFAAAFGLAQQDALSSLATP